MKIDVRSANRSKKGYKTIKQFGKYIQNKLIYNKNVKTLHPTGSAYKKEGNSERKGGGDFPHKL